MQKTKPTEDAAPSMEEILSSIRGVIGEAEKRTDAALAESDDDPDVLDLTMEIPEDLSNGLAENAKDEQDDDDDALLLDAIIDGDDEDMAFLEIAEEEAPPPPPPPPAKNVKEKAPEPIAEEDAEEESQEVAETPKEEAKDESDEDFLDELLAEQPKSAAPPPLPKAKEVKKTEEPADLADAFFADATSEEDEPELEELTVTDEEQEEAAAESELTAQEIEENAVATDPEPEEESATDAADILAAEFDDAECDDGEETDERPEESEEPVADKPEEEEEEVQEIDDILPEETPKTPEIHEEKPVKAETPRAEMPTAASLNRLLEEKAAEETSLALRELVHSIPRRKHESPGLRADTTLEALVIETIKPYLAEWLNENLADIVKQLVSKEIKKLLPDDDE